MVETGDRFSPNDPRPNVTIEALCRAPDGTIIRTPTGGTGVAICAAPNAWIFAEGTGYETDYEEKWTQLTPQATLEWTITPEIFTYATYSEGFKGGGFDDTPANVAQAITPFDPEEAKNYEIGIKSDFFDNRFRVNADVFYMDYTNLQVTQTNAACLCNITDNAASAEITGVEAEFLVPADPQPAAVARRLVRRCEVQGLHRVGDRSDDRAAAGQLGQSHAAHARDAGQRRCRLHDGSRQLGRGAQLPGELHLAERHVLGDGQHRRPSLRTACSTPASAFSPEGHRGRWRSGAAT